MRGIASPLPPLRIHPRPQDGGFCGVFIKKKGHRNRDPFFLFMRTNAALFLPSHHTDSQQAKAEEQEGHGFGNRGFIDNQVINSDFTKALIVKA